MMQIFRRWFGGGSARVRDFHANLVVGDVNGLVLQTSAATPAAAPSIPWAESLPEPEPPTSTFALLQWQTRLAPEAIGRGAELAALRDWAEKGNQFRIRFLTGPGGAGKTRLAAEFAQSMADTGKWHTGFARFDRGTALPLTDRGLAVLLDYPEAHREQVRALLREAAKTALPGGNVRLLLLSRRPFAEWRDDIDEAAPLDIATRRRSV